MISGQATVLYGAAAFSEDVDLWVEPSAGNLARLRKALADAGARYYKLTPPLTPALALRGHGFHFTVPSRVGTVYLDVMGRPPRVGTFAACLRRAPVMRTLWGAMPVLSISDLVEIKKTRRQGDYDVISALVRIRLDGAGRPARPMLEWALANSFVAEDLAGILSRFPEAAASARALGRPALSPLLSRRLPREARLHRCRLALAAEVAGHQRRDLRYWSPVLAELRRLRRAERLVPEGGRVEAGGR